LIDAPGPGSQSDEAPLSWPPAPLTRRLSADEIHVWCASLDALPVPASALGRFLSDDERARASRFLFPQHRERFTSGRGLLRMLLGGYLDAIPGDLRFTYGPQGKPALDGGGDLRFNVSHADDCIVFAVGRVDVGVDIEAIDRDVAIADIAARHFSAAERAEVGAAAADRRAFFSVWTRKEAYIKARGLGLSLDLSAFDAAASCGEDGWTPIRGADGEAWQVRRLPELPRHEGAVAAPVGRRLLRCWGWRAG
jgi:4'-phosphopantetheinyl transferase